MQTSIPGTGWTYGGAQKQVAEASVHYKAMTPKQLAKKIKQLEEAMYQHAKNLEFEQAARIRDDIKALQEQVLV